MKSYIEAVAIAEYVSSSLEQKNLLLDKYLEIINKGMPVKTYDLSDSEILEFIDENCSSLIFSEAQGQNLSMWTVYVDGISLTRAETLRNAVCKAAKKWGEANE